MKKVDTLALDSRSIGALPIINSFLSRIGLEALLSEYIVSHNNQKLSHAEAIVLFVRNILIEREPLYKLAEWAARFDAPLVGLNHTAPLRIPANVATDSGPKLPAGPSSTSLIDQYQSGNFESMIAESMAPLFHGSFPQVSRLPRR